MAITLSSPKLFFTASIIMIIAVLSPFMGVHAETCSELCSRIKKCASSKYGSYCKASSVHSTTTVCYGLFKDLNASICYTDSQGDNCWGSPVECEYDDYGFDEVTTGPTSPSLNDKRDSRPSPEKWRILPTTTYANDAAAIDSQSSALSSSGASRRRLTELSVVMQRPEEEWPSQKEVPKPVSTAKRQGQPSLSCEFSQWALEKVL
ncbi:hypothetical protein Pmar_PMAR023417 [Perkinsus marinus ATCC 50983]|uniref:Uncharacterized protein n=1 Tax=Perkinsus marinus (strain ATCC 50983 / TXsc) TaxID=423536 RepID=C5KKI0_PERM5|nr:hypothetical protein Pmar_PMAR023417 [Perkinsus marinus ATCC 50983]EER15092.1 hypothetical protein Pmar_PMAR023417 [Perkinsus marinus ATCC 50983]|eukprot:XP_002783296.1 hypothetical protein Pmar_PMAR023417 [Perkinsus marinus ATCC 50983]